MEIAEAEHSRTLSHLFQWPTPCRLELSRHRGLHLFPNRGLKKKGRVT